MPLTAEEQLELEELENIYGTGAVIAPLAPPPVERVAAPGDITSQPIDPALDIFDQEIDPQKFPTLSRQESEELEFLEATYGEGAQREFKGGVDEFIRALGSGALNVGSGLLRTLAQAGGPGAIFDAEAVANLADKAREISKKKAFQPGKDGGVKGFVANAVGQALPFMAGTIAATLTAGPAGGFAVAFAVEGSNAYEDALEGGASQSQAEMEGAIVGTINAALEALQVERVLKFAKAGKGSVKAIAAAAKARSLAKLLKAGKKVGKEALKVAVTEGIQEALQETTSVLAPALTGRELQEEGKIQRILQAGLGGAVAGPILGGGGAIAIAAFEKNTYSRKDMKEMGFTEQTSKEERKELFEKHKASIVELSEQEPEAPVEIDDEVQPQQVEQDTEAPITIPLDISETGVEKSEITEEVAEPEQTGKVKAFRGGTKGKTSSVKTASDTAQFGSGVYFGPEGVAEDFATERPDGEVQEFEIDTTNFFDERTAELDTPEGRKVADALIEAGLDKDFVESNFGGVGTLSFLAKGFKKQGKGKANLFPGSAEIKKAVQDAGFDGVVSEFQGSEQFVAYSDDVFQSTKPEPVKPQRSKGKRTVQETEFEALLAEQAEVDAAEKAIEEPVAESTFKGKGKRQVKAKDEILQKIPKKVKDQARKEVESDPLFEIEDEAQDIRGRQIDVGVFHVPANLKGEVAKAIEDDPSLKFNITHEKGKGTPFDEAVQEGLLERTGDTSGEMDIGEFLKRLSESKRSRRKIGGVSEAVLDKMIGSNDPFSEINAVKHTMLNTGFTIEEVNEAVESISREHNIDFEPITLKETADVKESARIPEKPSGEKKQIKKKKVGEKVVIKEDLLGRPIHPSEVAVRERKPKQKGLFGEKNTIVTNEEFEQLKAEEAEIEPLKGKQGKGLRKGAVRAFTAKDFVRAGKFALYYFEGGLREIQAFSEQMIKTMGESARPHLKKLFAEAKKTVETAEAPESKIKKPIPAVEGAKVKDKPLTQKVKKTGKQVESTSVIALQMQETLRSHGESLNLGYTPISIQEETDKAIAFVAKNPVEARQIAFAPETGDNLRSNAIRLAYAAAVEKSGDMVEYAKIANQILNKNRELGQAIVINRGFTGSPIEYVKQVVAARINQVGKKFGRGKKESAAKNVSQRVKAEVAKVKEKTDAVQMNIANAQKFIESLRC
jgi:hypothetical protein